MIHRLNSAQLSIGIKAMGAELFSVKNKVGIEFMWQANPQIWARHAPVLFPIVGKLKNDCYFLNEHTYQLNQHGFARDMLFDLIEANHNSCTFRLVQSAESKTKYPYDFLLDIIYTLKHERLEIAYHITNSGNEKLHFSIGAHPAFNVPLMPDEKFEDYVLSFGQDEYQLTKLQDGLISKKYENLHLNNKQLPINSQLFDADALVFEKAQIDEIGLFSTKNSHKITLNCKNWPFFGIWSKKGCGEFVCLEPWFGIADELDTSQVLEQKKGILSLDPEQTFNCAYSITFS
ncbi:MAG: aldose 1-epimerase family protein [Bacteroidota bacterium]